MPVAAAIGGDFTLEMRKCDDGVVEPVRRTCRRGGFCVDPKKEKIAGDRDVICLRLAVAAVVTALGVPSSGYSCPRIRYGVSHWAFHAVKRRASERAGKTVLAGRGSPLIE